MTRLCVPITVDSHEQALADALLASEHGADLVEYRVDTFTDLDDVRFLVEKSPLPCIVTCRPTWEGGHSDLPDQERIPVLESASLAGAAYIDIELIAYQRSANLRQKVHFNAGTPIDQTAPRENRKGMIVSSHDFTTRPTKLNTILADLTSTGGDINKIVWMARSVRDNLEAFEILRTRTKPTIALCMGEAGLLSRILAPKFGGFLTFAALRDTSATAPGQPTLTDLLNIYNFRKINPDTHVYGVVGHPIAHSLSPHIHNPAFAHEKINAVYVPFLVAPSYEAFKAFMESFLADKTLHLKGLSVTLPHKEHAFQYLKEVGGEISPEARRIGAINTIRVNEDGSLSGTSTDGNAILHSIQLGLSSSSPLTPDPSPLTPLSVAVIGAGGTGRTATAALTAAGAKVTLYNRTLDRAEAVAAEFSTPENPVRALPLEALIESDAKVFVQTTSVGMSKDHASSAWGRAVPTSLGQGTVAFDTVYTPQETTFLKQAKAAGATPVQGIEMFAHQAAAQFAFWTGRHLPLTIFKEPALRKLSAQ